MNKYIKPITFAFLFVFLMSCEDETVWDFPTTITLPVVSINADGATFEAELSNPSDFEIVKYGFSWSESPGQPAGRSEEWIQEESLQASSFSLNVNAALKKGQTYYVRAFVETPEYIINGNEVTFMSEGSRPPEITSISPLEASDRDTITITGNNFSYLRSANFVYFNQWPAVVISCDRTSLQVRVPLTIEESHQVSVTVADVTVSYPEPFIRK